MRSADAVTVTVTVTESQFTMRRLNDLVPANPPQRPIRAMVHATLVKMDASLSALDEAK